MEEGEITTGSQALLDDASYIVAWLKKSGSRVITYQPVSSALRMQLLEVEAGKGFARVRFDVSRKYTNFMGTVHGGIIATLLDETAGVAALALAGRGFTGTASAKINYLRAAPPGPLIGEAVVLKQSGSTILIHASVCNEDQSVVFAKAAITSMIGSLPERLPLIGRNADLTPLS